MFSKILKLSIRFVRIVVYFSKDGTEMEQKYDFKKGLPAMAVCYLIWGFQPLFFALDGSVDNTFLLACRIVWASVACLVILAVQGKLKQLKEVFTDKKILRREIPAAAFLFADWAIYLFAVRQGKVMECSMGYFIMPLVMYMFGAVIFREKVHWVHFVALFFIVVGIILSASGFGGFPYVTILLSMCFAIYSAIKKSLTVDSIVSTTSEILIILPVAVIYTIYLFSTGDTASTITVSRQLFLMGSGLITSLPMVFFAIGVRHIPLSMTGIFQYISPTLGIICSLILGETFTREKLISFSFIWVGVVIYLVTEFAKAKKAEN